MYEFDKNYQIELIKSLCNTDIITEINKYIVNNTNVNLSLCFPTYEGQQNTIYFVVDGDKDIALTKIGEILAAIKLKVDYDDTLDDPYIMLKCKELSNESSFTERYTDLTPYNPNNLQKIKEFFANHFSYLSPEIKALSIKDESVEASDTSSLRQKDKRLREKHLEYNKVPSQEKAAIDEIELKVESLSQPAREELFERLNKYKQPRYSPKPISGVG